MDDTALVTQQLNAYEAVIERGLNTFMEVGAALLAIRDERLYRVEFGTFEDYCRERWGMSKRHANRLISATETIEHLGPLGPDVTERQIRPLTSLEPDDQRLAWQLVTETAPNGKVTADHVKSVVNVLKEIQTTGALDPGTGVMLPISEAVKAAITEETYERMKRQETYIAEKSNGKLANHQLIHQSNSPEWYTPAEYVEAARRVMGGFDIDPASNDYANQTIQATIYYTEETNGLDKEWAGRCWMNPPYGSLSADFVAKLLAEFEAGNVTEAVVLVNSHATETAWFAPLWNHLLCFTDHRINFESPMGSSNGSTHGSVFIYLGDHREAFVREFYQFGYIVERVRYDQHQEREILS